ncbi:MAG: 23S rRNA (pseudouridine(1915)-N(3))-methyltransferase RlmH [Muribaculaceae bacterium]
MKITLAVVGKLSGGYLKQGIDDYTNRLSHYIPFNIQYIADAKCTKNITEAQQKKLEAKNILQTLERSDYVVLLDEHGKEYTSMEFSRFIERKMATVSKRLVFIVGGPYGFDEEVYARANEKISLSKMTFSHEMIRLIFTEQLYRAMTILNGEPYHHE